MEVEILYTTLILPPPSHQNYTTLPLSGLDIDPNLNVTIRTLRLYRPISGDPGVIIADALSKALVQYYPFEGSLRRRPSDNRLELWNNGTGVPLTRALSPLGLAVLLQCQPGDPFLDKLAPDLNNGEELEHPLSLQVTQLACGGFTLGMCVHHALCDGSGATQFLTTLAALARGLGSLEPSPVWDRATLLGPRIPLHVSFQLPFHVDIDPTIPTTFVRECFHISSTSMSRFRSRLDSSGSVFTSFEALGAFIWAAKVRASRVSHEVVVKFVYSMSIKKVFHPPLPIGYWGNTIIPVYVQLTAGELLAQPVWKTAEMIKESKKNVSDEYVRSYIDFQELRCKKGGAVAGDGVSAFTDWRHLGHSEVDFGSGGPIAVWPMSWKLMGSVEPCFFLPRAALNDGFRVLVSLRKDALEAFRLDMNMFREENLHADQILVSKISNI